MHRMTTTEIELKLLVDKATARELFPQVLRTVPVDPVYGHVFFSADGIDLPRYKEGGGVERYARECAIAGVIPFTLLPFEYQDLVSESILVSPLLTWGRCFSPPSGIDNDMRDHLLTAVLAGGRDHQVSIKIDRYGYDHFRDNFLPRILDKGYQIRMANLTLSTYHLTGYSQGDYEDASVSLDMRSLFPVQPPYMDKGEMVVKKGRELEDDKMEKVVEWFEQISKEYS